MQRFRKLASMMGVEHAIILAPMAGGPSTPALVAAVSNAGGLGSLGAGYMTPDDIAKAIAEIHERTSKPFAVNLFAGGYDGTGSSDTAAMLQLIAPWHERLGLPPPAAAPAGSLPPFEQQVEVVLRLEGSGVQLHLRHPGGGDHAADEGSRNQAYRHRNDGGRGASAGAGRSRRDRRAGQ